MRALFNADGCSATTLWLRRLLVAGGIASASLIIWPMLQPATGDASQSRTRQLACARWDEAAGEVIVRLVQSKSDVDLRKVGDAVFRIRRARRNCSAGWFRLACLDYQRIASGISASALRASTPGECVGQGDDTSTVTAGTVDAR